MGHLARKGRAGRLYMGTGAAAPVWTSVRVVEHQALWNRERPRRRIARLEPVTEEVAGQPGDEPVAASTVESEVWTDHNREG